jgi:Domain of unknown function (DUF1906)
MIRSLRVATLAVLIGGLGVSTSAASAHAGHKLVRFHGLSLRVPASWPVYDLRAHPGTCVRFNRHAVYLGTPSSEQRCPAHQVGRTEAILVSPTAEAARAGAGSALGALDGRSAAALTLHGLRVTATWGHSASTLRRVLGARRLASAARATAAAAAATARPSAIATRAGASAHAAAVVTGLGFDPCATPSSSAMSAWKSSPYRTVGVYLGGTNMACSQPNLTTSWTQKETAAGWHFIPTYVGLQAPGNSCGCAAIQSGHATSEGIAAANDAVARAKAVGIGPGNPIYFDMEAYTPGSATAVVHSFLTGWTNTLHTAGYVSGVYSSAASGISDLAHSYNTSFKEPDDIWIADWNGQHSTKDPYVPSADWPNHQRLHQYSGGVNQTYGGVTINIDGDYIDGAVAGAGAGTTAIYPDGTVIQDKSSLSLYRIAGGAPLFVSDLNAIGDPPTTSGVTPQQLASLPAVPADGTFLVTSTGGIFRVAGGAPLVVTSWSLFGGTKPSVLIDVWDIDNVGNPASHLRKAPANGTIVKGLPSGAYWGFSGGGRYPTGASARAIPVDDAGLLTFPQVAPPSGGGGLPGSCVAPGLRHKTLSQVKRALSRAHCRLGRVRRPRHVSRRHTLRVVSQNPRAKTTHAPGAHVGVTLA